MLAIAVGETVFYDRPRTIISKSALVVQQLTWGGPFSLDQLIQTAVQIYIVNFNWRRKQGIKPLSLVSMDFYPLFLALALPWFLSRFCVLPNTRWCYYRTIISVLANHTTAFYY